MKKLLVILAILFASGLASAQTSELSKIKAVEGTIKSLTPDKVIIPLKGEYLYLAKIKGGYAFFVSRNAELYERFSAKGIDSTIVLEGAVFKPLQRYTKRQWKKLSRKIKIYFPSISYKDLEKVEMYLIFNYGVVPNTASKKESRSTETTPDTNIDYDSDVTPTADPRSNGGKREYDENGLPK